MTTTAPGTVCDAELLRRYVEAGCADAFGVLAGRYLPLIYSAALRQTRDAHLAEDVAQATLVVLSQKAGGVEPALLAGWVLKATHYAARNALRQRARRVAHERGAAAMRSEVQSSGDPEAVGRVVDAALARLREVDRTAVVLRYFQNKSFAEIAGQLRTSEGAAQRRIARAVEKLRGILARQGVTISPAALPAALVAQAMQPVPSSLVSGAASLGGSKSGAASLIAKGALHAMAVAKVKVAVAIGIGALLVGVGVPVVYHLSSAPRPAWIPARSPLSERTFARPVSGSLPGGMGAEPVAVARIAGKRWFGPDGRPVVGIPDRLLTIAARLAPNATHAFCYHFTAPPRASGIGSMPHVEGAGGYGSGSYTDPATGVEWDVIGFPLDPGSDALTLTIRATDRPITTDAVVPAASKEAFHGTIAGHPLTVNPPAEQGGKARLGITFGEELSDVALTVYAIDNAGNKVWHSSTSLLEGKLGSRLYVYKVPLSGLREFRVESRPYNYYARYVSVPLAPVK